MYKQLQDSPKLTNDPLFPHWKSGEQLTGPCDGCGRVLPLLVFQDIAARCLVAFCKSCDASPPAELHRSPGSRAYSTHQNWPTSYR